MTMNLRIRLGLMLFLEYFIWGAWYVTLGTWLSQNLHFSGEQIGFAAGVTAVGAMLSPFLVGLIADRLAATERVLAVLHLLGAILLFLASQQTTFIPLYATILLYALCFMPTLSLTNSLAFRQMSDPQSEFGPIRVLGSFGWIVAGLLVGALKIEATANPVRLAALASAVMAAYCLTLPHTPPISKATGWSFNSIFPKEAVKLLADRSMAIFAIASFLICIPLQFYYAFTNLFLNQRGVANAAGKMTGGQMSELFFMLLLPVFFKRLGVKWMLGVGILAWVCRYILFAYGNAGSLVWMFYAAILLHGVCYDFFFVTGQIYIDRKASASLRAAAQGLITFITYGVGMFVGSWLSGAVVRHNTEVIDGVPVYNWQSIWTFAAGFSAVVLVLFLFAFNERKRIEQASPILEHEAPAAGLI